jgi:hypothetical protein
VGELGRLRMCGWMCWMQEIRCSGKDRKEASEPRKPWMKL